MRNLVRSDLYRMFKSKSFYICNLVAWFLIAINIFMLEWANNMLGAENEMYSELPFKDAITYGITSFSNSNMHTILAIFAGIFVCAEFAHGTMKNVVSKGFSKVHIYFSKVITMIVASFITMLSCVVIGTLSATIVMGSVGDFSGEYVLTTLKNMGIELLLIAALTSVLVMVAMVVRNLGGVIAINIVVIVMIAPILFIVLEYLTRKKIKFTEFSIINNLAVYYQNDAMPGTDYLRSAIVAVVFLVATCGLGLLAFKKSDVK